MTGPSPNLPKWAKAYFDKWKASFDGEMRHRREAFQALFYSDYLALFWAKADKGLIHDGGCTHACDHVPFLGGIIYATDAAVPDERYQRDPPSRRRPPPRLRDPVLNLARKLATQLAELQSLTPTRTLSGETRKIPWISSFIEPLVIYFKFTHITPEWNDVLDRHNIEFTCTSKRGYMQHYRASEALRQKVAANAQKLAAMTIDSKPNAQRKLAELIEALENWPEALDGAEAKSQKASWCDWLRTAHENHRRNEIDVLGHSEWADLARALFGVEVDERRVGQILNGEDC